MLIETVADQMFSQAVQTIAYDISDRNGRKQYVVCPVRGSLQLNEWITKILESGGHIDQVVSESESIESGRLTSNFLILYTADKEVRLKDI